ncbi:MAG: Ig-like domain-containing protein [Clostridiales Family XIII bacterium]|jgi:hypothetical protein|nr:Ig-like domain-containing protein [Clostridiales Family XIII bacterium]
MKQGKYRGLRRRIIALVICASLVVAAVAIGFAVVVSDSFAEPVQVATLDDPELTDETDDGGDGAETDDDVDDAPPSEPVVIEISRYPKDMNVGDKGAIRYEVTGADLSAVVRWDSSDDDIVSVDSDGGVRALSAGKAEITASLGEAKASILISVTDPIIKPLSFKVAVEEFSSADALLPTHDLKIGDELHMTVKVDPDNANMSGKFEWRVSSEGVVTIRNGGDINESATLKVIKDGEITLTVRYVDENPDTDERVELEDQKLNFRVAEEKTGPGLMLIIVFAAIVVVLIIVLIAIASGRKRRRVEEERRERVARKQSEEARRERALREEKERLMERGYEKGYRDSEADRFERITRVYDVPPTPPPAPPVVPPIVPAVPAEDDGEPEKPFSVDDIE